MSNKINYKIETYKGESINQVNSIDYEIDRPQEEDILDRKNVLVYTTLNNSTPKRLSLRDVFKISID